MSVWVPALDPYDKKYLYWTDNLDQIPTLSKKQKQVDTIQDDEIPTYARGAKLFFIMISVNLVVFLTALDLTIVSTVVPDVTNQFRSFSDVGWYGSAYLLTSTAFQPLLGRLYQSFNVKNIFLISFVVFEVGSLVCALAHNSKTFIIGRAIAGLGLAGGYTGGMIIVNIVTAPSQRPVMTSLMGATYGIGGTIGPLIGGLFTSRATWRWCFYLNLCFVPFIIPAILLWLQLPKVKHSQSILKRLTRVDWIGSVLILCSLSCILLVLQWGGIKYRWSDSIIIGLLIGFFLITILFMVEQYFKGEEATIPFRLFRNRTVAFGTLVNFGVAAAYFSLLYFLPIYFQTIRGSSALRSGIQTLPFIIAGIFSVTLTGILVGIIGIYVPFLLFGTALTAIGGGLLCLLTPNSSQATWCGLLFLAGFGPGMVWMLPFIASSAALPKKTLLLVQPLSFSSKLLVELYLFPLHKVYFKINL